MDIGRNWHRDDLHSMEISHRVYTHLDSTIGPALTRVTADRHKSYQTTTLKIKIWADGGTRCHWSPINIRRHRRLLYLLLTTCQASQLQSSTSLQSRLCEHHKGTEDSPAVSKCSSSRQKEPRSTARHYSSQLDPRIAKHSDEYMTVKGTHIWGDLSEGQPGGLVCNWAASSLWHFYLMQLKQGGRD